MPQLDNPGSPIRYIFLPIYRYTNIQINRQKKVSETYPGLGSVNFYLQNILRIFIHRLTFDFQITHRLLRDYSEAITAMSATEHIKRFPTLQCNHQGCRNFIVPHDAKAISLLKQSSR